MRLLRCVLSTMFVVGMIAGLMSAAPARIARAQADPCAGLPAYSQAMLAEEQRYSDQALATLDLDDLKAIAAATPQQLTAIVGIIDQHLKHLDQIAPPAFAADWHMAIASSGDLTQALFADGITNGIFSILVDYYDMSVRSDREIAEARAEATAACPDFDAFATQLDQIDGDEDSPVPGFAPWSGCTGLDQLGIDMTRANLQGMVDVPAAVQPLIAFADDWDADPSIGWNQLEFLSLADYYTAVAGHLSELTAPDYAAAWLQSTIDTYRALADIIRGAHGAGIMASSAENGGALLAASQAQDAAIASATQSCPQFDQFAEDN